MPLVDRDTKPGLLGRLGATLGAVAATACVTGQPPLPIPGADHAAYPVENHASGIDDTWRAVVARVDATHGSVLFRADQEHVITFAYDLAAYIQPPRFRSPSAFARELATSDLAAIRFLRDQLSPEVQAAVALHSSPKTPSPALMSDLVSELNRIIHQEAIYSPRRFLGVTLRESTLKLVGSPAGSPEAIRLNALLLEELFPDSVFPSPLLLEPMEKSLLVCTVHVVSGPTGASRVRFASWLQGSPGLGTVDRFFLAGLAE